MISLLVVVGCVFLVRYESDHSWKPAEVVTQQGMAATITTDKNSGAYILLLSGNPQAYYIASSPVPLDAYIGKPLHIYGHTVATTETLNRAGYPAAHWGSPVAAVALSNVQ